jgi:hypothetical protein
MFSLSFIFCFYLPYKFNSLQLKEEIIDFGEPRFRRHLVSGWSHPNPGDEFNFVWAEGKQKFSWVVFTLKKLNCDYYLVLKAYPILHPTLPSQQMEIYLNGRRLEKLNLQPNWQKYHLPVPSRFLRAGTNVMKFSYQIAAVPHKFTGGESDDTRFLTVAFDYLILATDI